MASRPIDEQLARLDALKSAPSSPESIAQLRKTLSSKSNVIVAKAAKMIEVFTLKPLGDALPDAFHRILGDKGCLASTAILKAMSAIELQDENVFLVGSKHVQMEPTWGGSKDSAVELRCESVAGLVRMNSRQMWEPLVRLLADTDPQARSVAARALGATGQDHARWLVQFKILSGDKEPNVMGELFSSILALTRSVKQVAPFLDSRDEELVEAAALALGESKLPEAFAALHGAHRKISLIDKRILLLPIAMTRQPEAIDYLISVIDEDVIEAMKLYRADSIARGKIRAAAQKSPALLRTFEKHFGGT